MSNDSDARIYGVTGFFHSGERCDRRKSVTNKINNGSVLFKILFTLTCVMGDHKWTTEFTPVMCLQGVQVNAWVILLLSTSVRLGRRGHAHSY